MDMIKACDLARNGIVSINGAPHAVEELRVTTPSARGAATLFRFRFRNLLTKAKLDMTCKGDEKFEEVEVSRRAVQFLYAEQDLYHFMDREDFSQFAIDAATLGGQAHYLSEDLEDVRVLIVNGRPLAIELPASVALVVAECEPSVRGQSATARAKPARTRTGLVVLVPEYIVAGETIRVDTRSGEFLGRA